ncbi:uncharacterized protein METZ01_LOCUS134755 [marine metagenome]|uniref:Uncharacterized protein n=1 Tax=marine metagenome TaxID=408172 RepID=A0A381YZ16_9ZZZZ
MPTPILKELKHMLQILSQLPDSFDKIK